MDLKTRVYELGHRIWQNRWEVGIVALGTVAVIGSLATGTVLALNYENGPMPDGAVFDHTAPPSQ